MADIPLWLQRFLVLTVFVPALPLLWAGDAKEYPLTLKVLETDAISFKADGTRTTTTCVSTPGASVINCDSRQFPGTTHTELVSFAEGSDGKTYLMQCVLGTAGRFLSGAGQGMAASVANPTVSGCNVPPGSYKARWDKGRLKVLHEKGGKSKETTFSVLSSAPIAVPRDEQGTVRQGSADKTILNFSSTPSSADIDLDGSFVGQTPSSIPAISGLHRIRISKRGYKQWEREITTSGGEATVAAELDPER